MDGWTNLFFQKFCTLLQCYSKWLVKYAFIHCSTGVQNNCKKTLVKCRKTQNFYKLIAKVQRNFPQWRGLDLLMLRIWGLKVKGLQSYWPSNFALAHSSAFTAAECASAFAGFEMARGRIICKVWWPVTLQSFDLQTSNFQQKKI